MGNVERNGLRAATGIGSIAPTFWECALAREIAKSADKMLIDLLGKLSLWPVAFQGRLFNR